LWDAKLRGQRWLRPKCRGKPERTWAGTRSSRNSPQGAHGLCKADVGLALAQSAAPFAPDLVTIQKPRQFYIHGITLDGRVFRPSDWSERLAGAMSSFRPQGQGGGIGAFIGYSPYCVPQVIDDVRCVLVSEALRDIEPMAWDFVMNFARDNKLPVNEVCMLPESR
jgi:Protein of unknown function (DUF3579)